MNVTEKIKARIEECKRRLNVTAHVGEYDDYGHGYNSGKEQAIEDELDFLIEILDDIERKALKEEGYNV